MRAILIVIISLAVQYMHTSCQKTQATDCLVGPSTGYTGTKHTTISGRTCQRWDAQSPHKPKKQPRDGTNHNYCRNPDYDVRGAWCYTTDVNKRWEYCNITKCDDDSLLIFSVFNVIAQTARILKIEADPELVKQQTDSTGGFHLSIVTNSTHVPAEYWALATHYRQKLIYYTERRLGYLTVYHVDTNANERHFEGMAHHIQNLAIDWKTNNIYWTDSKLKWVMVSDNTLAYYTPVYRSSPDPVYGLAIHSTKRFLFLSKSKEFGSELIRSDLAGKNEVVLFSYPLVVNVTGIAIDYKEERIYWTDHNLNGAYIMSSRFDGSDKYQNKYKANMLFWSIAAYTDYMFATETRGQISPAGNDEYAVWGIAKKNSRAFRYNLYGTKPRGIALYMDVEESKTDAESLGECMENNKCDQICLPRINAISECACSLGYHLNSTTNRCSPNIVDDNFLLLADSGQRKTFQIPITNATRYSIVPWDVEEQVDNIALDVRRGYIYLSSKNSRTLSRGTINGGKRRQLLMDVYVSSMIVDPQTGDLFFVDHDSNTISFLNGDYASNKTIVSSVSEAGTIKMLAQDISNRYIYWTDTFGTEGNGKVMRCRQDGSAKEVILDNLNWPHAITIDYESNTLFVVEAKHGVILATELSSLNHTSIGSASYKAYDLSFYLSSTELYITDFKVHEGMAYLAEINSNALQRFELSQGAVSLIPFGPRDFYKITSFSIFSKSHYTNYLAETTTKFQTTEHSKITSSASEPTTKSALASEDNDVINGIWSNILRAIMFCQSKNSGTSRCLP